MQINKPVALFSAVLFATTAAPASGEVVTSLPPRNPPSHAVNDDAIQSAQALVRSARQLAQGLSQRPHVAHLAVEAQSVAQAAQRLASELSRHTGNEQFALDDVQQDMSHLEDSLRHVTLDAQLQMLLQNVRADLQQVEFDMNDSGNDPIPGPGYPIPVPDPGYPQPIPGPGRGQLCQLNTRTLQKPNAMSRSGTAVAAYRLVLPFDARQVRLSAHVAAAPYPTVRSMSLLLNGRSLQLSRLTVDRQGWLQASAQIRSTQRNEMTFQVQSQLGSYSRTSSRARLVGNYVASRCTASLY